MHRPTLVAVAEAVTVELVTGLVETVVLESLLLDIR
jgi:hypothetical protein